MESHIGTLIKVLEVTFLHDVFGSDSDHQTTELTIKSCVRDGRRSVITTSRPTAGLVLTETETDHLGLVKPDTEIRQAGRQGGREGVREGGHTLCPVLPPPPPGKLILII